MKGRCLLSKKIILMDGNSLAYRAFFALPLLNNDKGIHTNAIYGFTMMLMKILEEEKPTHLLVAWDAGKTTFRHKTFQEYKGGRQKTPPELSEQFSYIREIVNAFGGKQYELEEFEADDIIGTLSLLAENENAEVKIISGDKDLTQLASEHTTVCITKKGITEIEPYTPEHIKEKYGLTPAQIIDMKGLMGDTSDNIPGVPGVGEKTAIKLLIEHHTIEELYEKIDQVSGKKLKENLEENKDLAFMSKQLATINREAPVEIELPQIEYKGPHQEKIQALFKELSFQSLLDKIGTEATGEEAELETLPFETAETIDESILADEAALIMEVFDENYHKADIIGCALISSKGRYFIPAELLKSSDKKLKAWLEDPTKKKWVYDSKQTIVSLQREGIAVKGIDFDLLLAAYLVNPSETFNEVADVAKLFDFKGVLSNDLVYGKGSKRHIPDFEQLKDHITRKATAVFELRDKVLEKLEENDQISLYYDLEFPLAQVLAEMEHTGVQVDKERLLEMQEELAKKIDAIEKRIYELAGETFNINSPKQLGVILFEKLGLPTVKKTKTGYSTSADVLEKLEDSHEVVKEILHYRQLGKLQSTYIEGLLKVIWDNGKVHTRFSQVIAQTGRLSSIDPNLQNIPIRLEEGRKIRQAFIPSEKDWVIFAADYSQIELRVLAHISQDQKLIDAFREDLDIHTKTAMDVFHVSEEEVTSNMRRQAKAVNFGIVYGISDYGLSQNLGITRKEAATFIEKYFASFPGVKEYMKTIVQSAKEKGYVTTLLHRRRYIPEITSRNFNLRSFAERTAMNTPIQGSAADIIKKAMIDMAKRLKAEKLRSRLLLQVHDELIFEAPKDEIEILKKIVPDVMENAVKLDVPLKVDMDYGNTWFDAK
ncbi:DNA polymerase I [Bacillus oleivorans]|uniref:DNA polymerase I n=1 Tax=Bacillus oleivorans TaxID=1448271 RepID=UPI000BE34CB2|nr:DNA polymerase I [Bacillus oleivorans]